MEVVFDSTKFYAMVSQCADHGKKRQTDGEIG